ncbi:hypothetical protein ERJ75_001798100 [Trypanosoma vivax]|nr:hypothetical protein ERJ75_001798100 [Trypanosoma vivax]
MCRRDARRRSDSARDREILTLPAAIQSCDFGSRVDAFDWRRHSAEGCRPVVRGKRFPKSVGRQLFVKPRAAHAGGVLRVAVAARRSQNIQERRRFKVLLGVAAGGLAENRGGTEWAKLAGTQVGANICGTLKGQGRPSRKVMFGGVLGRKLVGMKFLNQ